MKSALTSAPLALALALLPCSASAAGLLEDDVFVSGADGYHTYRIPALVVATNGAVLAFCEGRKNSGADTGKIDLLLKRSTDGGKTWLPQQVVWSDGRNVCGNPAPVVDRETGMIWLLMTWNLGADDEKSIAAGTSRDTRRVFVTHSRDNGQTWTPPAEITASVKRPDWRWYATGPGNGIQLTRGAHRGRLVIPCNHSEISPGDRPISRSHIIYSDDHGQTWRLGGVEDKPTNESTVVELSDGALLQNMRSDNGKNRRAVAVSHDGGLTWLPWKLDETLIEPVCQANLLRCTWPEGGGKSRILFSNPASVKRERMTVRVSYDEGTTWPVSRVLWPGPAAYSCLAILPDQTIGCLFERGAKRPYEKITLARFPLNWLEAENANALNWTQLPPLPDPLGLAGAFAGVSDGALLVAGGANFPGAMPWDGGEKVWHDAIFVLSEPNGRWTAGCKLPRPLAYGVSVSTPDGVLCAGGSSADGISRSVFLLQWNGGKIEVQPLPPMPQPMANGCGALIGKVVYLAGGVETPDATNAMKNFWALDLTKTNSAWRELEPWPGPARMLAVAGVWSGDFFLFSGAELHADATGKPVRRYLRDAYRFTPGQGWRRLSDLPRAAVAAPSPAIAQGNDELLVVSGDDGKRIHFKPMPQHPGFPKDVLAYNPRRDVWRRLANSPLSRATAPVVEWRGRAVIVNGEVRPGRRTPEVWSVNER